MDVLLVALLVVFGVACIRHAQQNEGTEKTFHKWYGWLMILLAAYWAAKSGLLARLLTNPQ